MGQITAVAFENQKCGGFVTISRLGWLCLWHIESQTIIHQVKIYDQPRIQDCSLMRYLDSSGHLFCHFPKEAELLHINLAVDQVASDESDQKEG